MEVLASLLVLQGSLTFPVCAQLASHLVLLAVSLQLSVLLALQITYCIALLVLLRAQMAMCRMGLLVRFVILLAILALGLLIYALLARVGSVY